MNRRVTMISLAGIAVATACLAAVPEAPSLAELKNGTYHGFEEPKGPVRLENGHWEGAPLVQGGAARPSVAFVRDFRLVGDADGDGGDEAIVLLAQNSGGTGEFLYLAVVGRRDGAPHNVATALLGDRVKVRDARIDGRRIVLDVVQAGDRDAACCPGDLVTRSWQLQGAALQEGTPERQGRLTTEAMAGADWVLRSWTATEPAASEPAVTLVFEGGRFAGHAGCNRYTAGVEAGDQPGDIAVGPIAGTRMMCPGPVMATETRFLRSLGGARKFTFVAGQLALTTEQDGTFTALYFDRATPR